MSRPHTPAACPPDAPQVLFGVLGPIEVWRDGALITPRSKAHRALLGVLLAAEGHPLSRNRILDLVWGDAPSTAGSTRVHVAISRLRDWLQEHAGPAVALEHTGSGYRLLVAPDALDLGRFRRLVERARAAAGAAQLLAWEQALALWRGTALAGGPSVPRHDAVASGIDALRRDAACAFADAALAAGEPHRALGELDRLAAEHPLDERLTAALALLLAGSGRQSDALAAIERCRTLLADELGLDPGRHLSDVQQQVLQQRVGSGAARSEQAIDLSGLLRSTGWAGAQIAALQRALTAGRVMLVLDDSALGTAIQLEIAEALAAQAPSTPRRRARQPRPRTPDARVRRRARSTAAPRSR